MANRTDPLGCTLEKPVEGNGRMYLAGAYTKVATDDGAKATGTIRASSPWRQILEGTEHELQIRGWDVFLPHRDVSRWGRRNISPATVAQECLSAVAASDAMIAVLGESYGTHLEVGVALGFGIPVAIIRLDGGNESYFGSGVADSDMVSTVTLTAIDELRTVAAAGFFDELLGQGRRGLNTQLGKHPAETRKILEPTIW